MSMSASQAREIALTARMSDIEYQGQQINQQRTTLSNQVNALYSQLENLRVPVPPSTIDFTTSVTRIQIGADTCTISNIRPDGPVYTVDASYSTVGHYLTDSNNVRVTRSGDDQSNYTYTVGDYDVYNLEDTNGQQISTNEMAKYIEAIRNRFTQWSDPAVISDDELMQKFAVYFTPSETERATGAGVPHFILREELDGMLTDNQFLGTFIYSANGTYTATKTFNDVEITFTSQGAFESFKLPVYDSQGNVISRTSHVAETTSATDEVAYKNAFNEYEYEKYKYDKMQQEINKKTSIIQAEDKNLELKLTRLDNERKAINTEMEAVKKVIQENIEKSYKVFGG